MKIHRSFDLCFPLSAREPKISRIAVLDLEAKRDARRRGKGSGGFNRPFLAVLRDSQGQHHVFRDAPRARRSKDWKRWPRNKGGCIDRLLEHIFATDEYLASGVTPCFIWGHNAGGFDALHLLLWFQDRRDRFEVESSIASSHVLEMRVFELTKSDDGKLVRSKRRWIFRDSMAVIRSGLDRAAKDFQLKDSDGRNFQKQEMDYDADELDARWEPYCVRDVDVVAALLERVESELKELGGHLAMTASSIAMNLFRRNFLPKSGLRYVPRHKHFPDCLDVCEACHNENCIKRCVNYDRCDHCRKHTLPDCAACGRLRACATCRKKQRPKVCPLCSKPTRSERKRCPTWPMGCHHAWAMGNYSDRESSGAMREGEHGHRHGGRTEVHKYSERRFVLRYFDINSSYPASMIASMPVGKFSEERPTSHRRECPGSPCEGCGQITLDDLHEEMALDESMCLFVEAIVRIPPLQKKFTIPPLPVVRDGKLLFPVGTFYGRFAWPELRHLRECGGEIVRAYRIVRIKGRAVFRPMIEELWNKRNDAKKAGNVALAETCKLLMNGCAGKLAQRPNLESSIMLAEGAEWPDTFRPANPWPDKKTRNGKVVSDHSRFDAPFGYVESYSEASFFLPHVNSWITSLSRERLWIAMRDVESRGGRVVYTDTDSILTDGELPCGSELGQWKDEFGSVRVRADFDGPKVYRLQAPRGKVLKGKHRPRCGGDDCKGCAREVVHIKGVDTRLHTSENFETWTDGRELSSRRTSKIGKLAAEGEFTTIENFAKRRSHTKGFSKKLGIAPSIFADKREAQRDLSTLPWELRADDPFSWDPSLPEDAKLTAREKRVLAEVLEKRRRPLSMLDGDVTTCEKLDRVWAREQEERGWRG